MKNIKRTLITSLIILLLCNTLAFASITPRVTIEKCFIDEAYTLNVEASFEDALKNHVAGVILKNPDGDVIFADQVTLTEKNDDGNYTASFGKFKFEPRFESGSYYVKVSGDNFVSDTSSVTYYGVDVWSDALNAMVNADGQSIITAAEAIAIDDKTNAEMIGIDTKAVKDLADKSVFFAILDHEDAAFDLTGLNPETDEGALAIQDVVISFKKLWSDAQRIGEYFNSDTASEVMAWFDMGQKIYDDNPISSNTMYDFNGELEPREGTDAKKAFLTQSYKINGLLDNLKKADTSDKGTRANAVYDAVAKDKVKFSVDMTGNSWDEPTLVNAVIHNIALSLREQIILKTVEFMPSEHVGTMISSLRDVLDIDYTALDNVKDKSTVYSAIAGNSYSSLSSLEDAIDKAAENYSDTGSGSAGSGMGSTGGSKGGSVSISGGKAPAVIPSIQQTGKYFADVPEGFWAADAINGLYEKGVVSGKSSGGFDPDGAVTRGEYVKMLICALGFDTDNIECDFTDVTKGMWQYPYVAAAAELGIVNGLGNGSFGVNDVITRQDMAVIAERAIRVYGVTLEEESCNFYDSWTISSYAIKSVGLLCKVGIVNGMPDGSFAPFGTVSRAQAAAIIFRTINNY